MEDTARLIKQKFFILTPQGSKIQVYKKIYKSGSDNATWCNPTEI